MNIPTVMRKNNIKTTSNLSTAREESAYLNYSTQSITQNIRNIKKYYNAQ